MDFLVMTQNKKFYNYPPHYHEYWEILLNIEGEGTAIVDGRQYSFRPGTIFCIRPGILHSKCSADGFVDGSILLRDFCFGSEAEDLFIFQDDERQSFYLLFKLGYEFPMNPATDLYGERFLRSLMDAMQNLLSHWRDDAGKNKDVLYVQKTLAAHVSDANFKLEGLIASTSYSPNHFRKLFKDQCGCSPLQYYNKLKIQRAKQLLLQYKSIMSISEIARNCGFEDPYYFSRAFRKETGLSPMQFYQQSKKNIPLGMEELEKHHSC